MATVVDGRTFIDTMLQDDDRADTVAPAGVSLAFTIKKFVLQILLERAALVVATRDVMPVLKNFQFELRPGRLRVVATDLELSMIATTEMVTVTTPGLAVFPARKMLDIVREAKDGDVTVTVTGGLAAITIGPTTWRLKLQAGDDYPALPDIDEATFTTVDRVRFAAALTAVKYAACKDAERASLMMIDIKDGRMTACDGSRIQQATVGDLPFDIQIPIGAVDDLIKLLKGVDLPAISIGESANHLSFRVGADVFVVNKLVARFPNMEAMLLRPALENKHELTVDRADLLHAVRRVRITADPQTSALALRLAPGTLTVIARDKYGDDAAETVPAGWAGAERTLVVNHAFLTDMLAGYDAKDCSFWLGDDTKTRKTPLLLKDPHTATVGVVQQMLADWVGA